MKKRSDKEQKKIAIIGASYLQRPLVQKAKELGIETHVFAWQEGNVVSDLCDFFYPISILDQEAIYSKCHTIKIDGICTIASDLAAITVSYVASKLNLKGNTFSTIGLSTNKLLMRNALSSSEVLCPKYCKIDSDTPLNEDLKLPIIVKPVDRSGSRGIKKITDINELTIAIKEASEVSLCKEVIAEEYISGEEFSVEFISYDGLHYPLAITKKITSGPPHFVELEHIQPAKVEGKLSDEIFTAISKALDALKISNGASHSEIMITAEKDIYIIEIGGRMGGDLIGSHLTPMSTGYDYLKGVIDCCLGKFTPPSESLTKLPVAVKFITASKGLITEIKVNSQKLKQVLEVIKIAQIGEVVAAELNSSAARVGCYIYIPTLDKINTLDHNNVLRYITTP